MFNRIIGIILLTFSFSSFASWRSAETILAGNYQDKTERIILELVSSGYYFSALPLMKNYLLRDGKNLNRKMDSALTKLIENVGGKHFETLPGKYLSRSGSSSIYYILAKKEFRKQKFNLALDYLARIQSGHKIYPFAKHMEATIAAFKGNSQLAASKYQTCISTSESFSGLNYQVNRDSCIAGKARVEFNNKNYDRSDLLYLDVPKGSRIWPEILFEEAWNSFYQGNYNRTLGKLVSYKAPVFEHFFNPEVEVLTALSYLKLCLYQDAKSVSDKFYDENWHSFRKLHSSLRRNSKKASYFYNQMIDFEKNGKAPNSLVRKILKSIRSDFSYKEQKNQLQRLAREFEAVRDKDKSRLKALAMENLQDSLRVHKLILGAYLRGKFNSFYQQLYQAFEGISYIKLEVLAQRKAKLYDFSKQKRSRGDVQYIERNEKQYFWDFNGEFWADELGDYVFALKPEC